MEQVLICRSFSVLSEVINAESLKSSHAVEPQKHSKNQWCPTVMIRTLDSTLKANMMSAADSEPGFDLTDEEMAKFKIWPRGVIPYYVDEYSFDKVLRDRLRYYLVTVNQLTGLQFLEMMKPPEDKQSRWVFFINRRGVLDCVPHTTHDFTNTGVQKVILGYDCFFDGGGLAASILGIVGVPPMHTAPVRFIYVSVVDDNIIKGKEDLFEQLNDTDWLFHEIPYEYTSAGHFHWHQYSSNGGWTLKPTGQINQEAGGNREFTYNDIWKIRMLYSYIKNKKATGKMHPQCKNMFEPGLNFSYYIPEDPIEDKPPRPKPDKYLGIVKPIQIEKVVNEKKQSEVNTIEGNNVSNQSGDTSIETPTNQSNIEQGDNESDKATTKDINKIEDISEETNKTENKTDSSRRRNSNINPQFTNGDLIQRRWGFTNKASRTKKLSRYNILQLPEFKKIRIKRKRLRINGEYSNKRPTQPNLNKIKNLSPKPEYSSQASSIESK